MRAYIAHNMDENEKLLVDLEMTRSEVVVAWKLAKEDAYLLRKVEEEKKALQVEVCRLVEEKAVMAIEKEKAKKETTQLRRELQDLWVGLATQKDNLKANY